jgi:hypothetical protein
MLRGYKQLPLPLLLLAYGSSCVADQSTPSTVDSGDELRASPPRAAPPLLPLPLLNTSFTNAPHAILRPNRTSNFDSTVLMNPNIVRVGNQWRLFYAGADNKSTHRIALATAPVEGPTPINASWTRRGVVVDVGKPHSFNSRWSVLPLCHKFGDKWHLYFSGRSDSCPYGKGSNRTGLQLFWGIGLATSDDGIHFVPRANPVIMGNETAEYPDNFGVAGGGSIIEDLQPDGSVVYRQFYTLAVGHTDPDIHVDQKKLCAVAHSRDGVTWYNHSVIMGPLPAGPREDVACAAPVVWRDGDVASGRGLYRMIYSAIGTRWGYYSLAQAVSRDGYIWQRGDPRADADLILAPDKESAGGHAWDSQMVECEWHPSLWP